jgi:hypothetical protein
LETFSRKLSRAIEVMYAESGLPEKPSAWLCVDAHNNPNMHNNAAYWFFIGIRLGYRAHPLRIAAIGFIFFRFTSGIPPYGIFLVIIEPRMTQKPEYFLATETMLQGVGGLAVLNLLKP